MVREIVNTLEAPGEQRAHLIFIGEITVPEVAAAVAVVHRTGRIRRPVWDYVFDPFMDDVSWRFQPIKVDRDDFFSAALLTRNHPLKGYDAVHLAVALHANARLAVRRLRLPFVSADGTLLAAAQAEGLLTENPFNHVSALDTPTDAV